MCGFLEPNQKVSHHRECITARQMRGTRSYRSSACFLTQANGNLHLLRAIVAMEEEDEGWQGRREGGRGEREEGGGKEGERGKGEGGRGEEGRGERGEEVVCVGTTSKLTHAAETN